MVKVRLPACWGQDGFSWSGHDKRLTHVTITLLLIWWTPRGEHSHGKCSSLNRKGSDSRSAALALTSPVGLQAETQGPREKGKSGGYRS